MNSILSFSFSRIFAVVVYWLYLLLCFFLVVVLVCSCFYWIITEIKKNKMILMKYIIWIKIFTIFISVIWSLHTPEFYWISKIFGSIESKCIFKENTFPTKFSKVFLYNSVDFFLNIGVLTKKCFFLNRLKIKKKR